MLSFFSAWLAYTFRCSVRNMNRMQLNSRYRHEAAASDHRWPSSDTDVHLLSQRADRLSHRAVFRGIGRLLPFGRQCKQGKEAALVHVSTAVDLLGIPFPVCHCQTFSDFQTCSWCRALSFVLNLRHDNLDLKRACFLALSGKVRTTPEVGTAVTLPCPHKFRPSFA